MHVRNSPLHISLFFFFFNDPATTEIYTLSLHDALPIFVQKGLRRIRLRASGREVFEQAGERRVRSEEHTSELQSRFDLVCRLLLEKKKKKTYDRHTTRRATPSPCSSLYGRLRVCRSAPA